MKIANALTGIGGVTFGVAFGRHVPGENTLRHSFNASLRRNLFDRDTGFSLLYFKNEGQIIFGQVREDLIMRISVDREVNKFITIAVSAQQRRSTVDIFDEEQVNVDFLFVPGDSNIPWALLQNSACRGIHVAGLV